MATKKQKREAALAKRENFLEEVRQQGLEAQEREQEFWKAEENRLQEAAERINRRHRAILQGHLSPEERNAG